MSSFFLDNYLRTSSNSIYPHTFESLLRPPPNRWNQTKAMVSHQTLPQVSFCCKFFLRSLVLKSWNFYKRRWVRGLLPGSHSSTKSSHCAQAPTKKPSLLGFIFYQPTLNLLTLCKSICRFRSALQSGEMNGNRLDYSTSDHTSYTHTTLKLDKEPKRTQNRGWNFTSY